MSLRRASPCWFGVSLWGTGGRCFFSLRVHFTYTFFSVSCTVNATAGEMRGAPSVAPAMETGAGPQVISPPGVEVTDGAIGMRDRIRGMQLEMILDSVFA